MIKLGRDDETLLTKKAGLVEKAGPSCTTAANDDLDDAIDILQRVEMVGNKFMDAMKGTEVTKLSMPKLKAIGEMKAVVREVTEMMDNHRGYVLDADDHAAITAMAGTGW